MRLTRLCSRTAAVVALAGALAACASTTSTLSSLPPELGGLPADTPARPQGEQLAYPAVHDMPPPRDRATMTPEQLKRAEAEMIRARDRQAKQAGSAKARPEQ